MTNILGAFIQILMELSYKAEAQVHSKAQQPKLEGKKKTKTITEEFNIESNSVVVTRCGIEAPRMPLPLPLGKYSLGIFSVYCVR